ncbi:MAG TPA: phosphoribosylanthranilate isomerase [Pyrinomonadaceae bacterium]|nr:phosphoribosylanthranilate isomerase [Pyrinomonadaceae bacterium]
MKPSYKTRVKICCIASVNEARMAIDHGADAIGLVSAMPSGPGPIAEELIAEIARSVPASIGTFLLTCKQDVSSIIAQQQFVRVNTIQICDRLVEGSYDDIRDALPGVKLVQVIHVSGNESVEEAIAIAPFVDSILLDSGNQSLAVKELGGTGRVHDWGLSRRIRESIDVPIFLAGGLKPENVSQAIAEVRPFGVDVCSSLRPQGSLDLDLLASFFNAIDQVRPDASKAIIN